MEINIRQPRTRMYRIRVTVDKKSGMEYEEIER